MNTVIGRDMSALDNARQELFAQAIVKGLNGRDAYKSAGYSVRSIPAADASASRMLRDVKVRARIVELQNKGAKRAEVTVESLLAELETARKLAEELRQPAAMISASMGKGKVAGLIVEKRENGKPGDFSDMSDDELYRIAATGRTGDITPPPRPGKLN